MLYQKCEGSFQKLKNFLISIAILAFQIEGSNFIVFYDPTFLGLGVVLV